MESKNSEGFVFQKWIYTFLFTLFLLHEGVAMPSLDVDPFARIITNSTDAICEGDTLIFTDNSFSTSTDIDTWNWTFTGGNPATATGIGPHEVSWSTAGTYEVQLIVATNGIEDTTTYQVNVVTTPTSADFTETVNLDNGPVNVQLTPSNFNSNFHYTWIVYDLVEGEVIYNDANVSHLIQVNGEHTGQLIVSNGSCSSAYNISINSTGGEGDIAADFSVSDTSICINSYVTFEHENTTDVTNWEWDFGKGASPRFAYNQGPIQVYYSTSGTKIASLTTNGSGVIETSTQEITVGASENGISIGVTPQLSTDADTVFVEPNVSITFRPNGESGLAASYFWDFGNPLAETNDSTSESRIAVHSFDTGGLYAVKLMRESAEGCTNEFVQYVKVATETNQSGNFAISPSGKTCVFNSVSFVSKARGFSQGAGEVAWFFGAENDAFPQTSDGFIPDSVYWATPGQKIIKVVSKGTQDYEDSVVHTLLYDVLPYPEATFSFNDTIICSDQTQPVSFLPSLQLEYGIYNWTVVTESGTTQTSSSVQPSFQFAPDETYMVSLSVSNSYCKSSYARTIHTGTNCEDLWAGIVVKPARENCGLLRYVIEGIGSDNIQNWDFDFGGGTAAPEADGTSAGPFTVNFFSSGSQVSLTVTDNNGNEETVTVTLDGSDQIQIP